ncbi:hypothetical protein FRB91_009120 [Serendipita sp. 411]|nr:hypothetical protein FRC15_004906 [Serendipita sp. 397]KAG8858876.1 hypothetical protein FRB91_009120 [Serendipita sp. 411]
MRSFEDRMASAVDDAGKKGWLVAILECAWLGTLVTGYLADKLSRRYTIILAVVVFIIGAIVQVTAQGPPSIYGGRFVVGLGVGSLSMIVPLYNAELAPPEVRGSLVALQQLAIVFGILVSFWIDYGTNYIGGTGETQSEAAWRLPLALQIVPALILGVGALYLPFSPRWLVNQGREEEALQVLSHTRDLPADSELINIEFLEIKAQYIFEKETSQMKYPQWQDGSFSSDFKLGLHEYISLLGTPTLRRRVAVATITMFFQQFTGINAILYYAPTIFKNLGLTGNTISLLATGVVGIVMFLATIPAVLYVDQLGRKPVLISGAFIMAACHFIVGIISSQFQDSWPSHKAAGWAACVFVWIFSIAFGYSWGPCAWIIVSEIWPLSVRAKGVSIGASSNWMNNFIIGQVTPPMMEKLRYGTFIFFGLFSFFGGLFIFLIPETSGLTLEEMDTVFGAGGDGLAKEDQQRQEEIYRRLGLTDRSPSPDEKGKSRDEKATEEHQEHRELSEKA